jgi:hypothetical protein
VLLALATAWNAEATTLTGSTSSHFGTEILIGGTGRMLAARIAWAVRHRTASSL